MITRYSRPEMRAIWTDENKLRLWLQIELLASEALVRQKKVPAAALAKIKAKAHKKAHKNAAGAACFGTKFPVISVARLQLMLAALH